MILKNTKIQLVKDTIDKKDISSLTKWLKTSPQLTKGDLTVEFEAKWSQWLGRKYSVFVNSGSAANLAAVYSLMLSGKMKNKKIIVPAVSWVTTVTPAIHLGLNPIMCECDEHDLGLNINHLKELIEKENPAAIILVHVLGIPNQMNHIISLCKDNDILLIEDCCEAIGSEYAGKHLGTFGELSTFSFYFSHHMSTIEGGMISTDNEELYYILLAIRSHGWDRDLPIEKQKKLREKYQIDDFRALYTFYYPGFNLRSTDLQAFIGLRQLEKLNGFVKKRNHNFMIYHNHFRHHKWRIEPPMESFVSNFAYPIITENRDRLVTKLKENNIDSRPLICGSINEHPFWYERYGYGNFPFAKNVHEHGLYLPNNHDLSKRDLMKIINVVNENI
jgi:CDP-6-deoxy-D-xylo-4-hexulose-3-dehydrase